MRRASRSAGRMRWHLVDLQDEYQECLDHLPDSLGGSALADKLEAICELDLDELDGVEPPLGYGRDPDPTHGLPSA